MLVFFLTCISTSCCSFLVPFHFSLFISLLTFYCLFAFYFLISFFYFGFAYFSFYNVSFHLSFAVCLCSFFLFHFGTFSFFIVNFLSYFVFLVRVLLFDFSRQNEKESINGETHIPAEARRDASPSCPPSSALPSELSALWDPTE